MVELVQVVFQHAINTSIRRPSQGFGAFCFADEYRFPLLPHLARTASPKALRNHVRGRPLISNEAKRQALK